MFEATMKIIKKYKKKKNSMMNTFDILRPINIISNFMAFRIFEYPRGRYRPRLTLLYMIVISFFYYGGWYCQGLLFSSSQERNLLQGALYNITGTINQFAIFVIVTVGFHQTKSLKQSVKRIHEIDITLQALGSPPSFNIIHKRMMAMLLFAIVYLILYTLLNFYVYQSFINLPNRTLQEVSSTFVQIYGQSIEFILIMEFVTIVSCIDSEFRRANDLLRNLNILPLSSIAMELLDQKESNDPLSINKCLFPSSNKLFTLIPSSQRIRSHLQLTSHIIRTRRLLQTIRQIHLELYRVSKSIGIIYGIQISMEMGLCILYLTYDIYSLYDTYQSEGNNNLLLAFETVGTFVMCFNNAIKIIGVNYTCERTSREAERTNEIICTFYGQNTDYEIQEEMKIFSLQMMQCRPSYSAFGLYSLNCKNICSCIGTITTYIIITIQVTNSIMEEVS